MRQKFYGFSSQVGNYSNPNEFAKDVRLIFENSKNYNTNKKSRIYAMTVRLSAVFEEKIRPILSSFRSKKKTNGESWNSYDPAIVSLRLKCFFLQVCPRASVPVIPKERHWLGRIPNRPAAVKLKSMETPVRADRASKLFSVEEILAR